jgi:hypothetical protein
MPEQKKIRLGNYCPKIVVGVEGFYLKNDVIESLKKINLLYEHPGAITGKDVYRRRVLWWEINAKERYTIEEAWLDN